MSRYESVWLEALERRRVMSAPAVLGAEFVQFAFGETFAEDVAWSAHQLGDGRILVRGFQTQAVFTRLNADFSIDTTFGDSGFVRLEGVQSVPSIVVADDGSFYAFGEQPGLWPLRATRIVRFTADGFLDTSFGENGVSVVGFGAQSQVSAQNASIDPQGRLVFSGLLDNRDLENHQRVGQPQTTLFRVNADGSVDHTFGTDGLLVLGSNLMVGEASAFAFVGGDIEFRPDGGFYFGGEIVNFGGPATSSTTSILSFTSGGALDQSFGVNGEAVLFGGGENSSIVSEIELTSTGDLIAVVSSIQPTFTPQSAGQTFPLLRLYKLSGGALDTTFSQGVVIDDDTFPQYPDLAPGQPQNLYSNFFAPGAAAVSIDAEGAIRVAYQEVPRVELVNAGLDKPAFMRVKVFNANGEFTGEAERAVAVQDHLLTVFDHFFTSAGDLVSIGTIYTGGYFDSKLSPEEYFARSGTGDIFITRLITADDITAPLPDAPAVDAPASSAPIERASELPHESHRPPLISLLSSDDDVDEFTELLAA